MKTRYIQLITIICALIAIGSMTACGGKELRANADALDRTAAITEDTANRILDMLERFGPGQVEESELAEAIERLLPTLMQQQFASAVKAAGDVRTGAVSLSDELRVFSQRNRDEAEKLRIQAARDEASLNNAKAIGEAWLSVALGGTTFIGAAIATLSRIKERKATLVAEDIITSIESSPVVRKAIDEGGGSQLRSSMLPSTMKYVKKVRQEA